MKKKVYIKPEMKVYEIEPTVILAGSERGSLYDDIHFTDIKTGDAIYTIAFVKKDGQTVELWGKENNFKHPFVIGDWKDIKEYFGI